MMPRRIVKFACVAACLLIASAECAGFEPLVVAPGESVMITTPGTNNSLTVHGSLGFDLGGTWAGYNGHESYTYLVLSDDLKSQTTLSVAPDPGEPVGETDGRQTAAVGEGPFPDCAQPLRERHAA